MRFIHKHPGGRVVAIPGEDDLYTGRPKRRPVVAVFKLGALHPWELEAARQWRFRGVYLTGEPGSAGEAVDPIGRVSYYDTLEEQKNNGWTDEFREEVEQGLLRNPFHGQDFKMVEAPALPKPWPKYDELVAHGRRTVEMVAERIVETVQELGLDPRTVVDYERANLNRPEVVNALLASQEPESEEIEVAA